MFSKTPQELKAMRQHAAQLKRVINECPQFAVMREAVGYKASLDKYEEAESALWTAAQSMALTEPLVANYTERYKLYRARIMLDHSDPEIEAAIQTLSVGK
jgi:hypothetical protein